MKSRNPNRERTLQEGAKIDKSIRKRLEKHVRGDDRKMQLAGTNHYLKRKELSCEQPRLSAHSSSKDHQKSALHYITLHYSSGAHNFLRKFTFTSGIGDVNKHPLSFVWPILCRIPLTKIRYVKQCPLPIKFRD